MPYKDNDFGIAMDDVFGWLGDNSNGFGTGRLYENVPEELAQKNANLTMGKGLLFDSDNKQALNILNKEYRQNNLLYKFQLGEYIASMYGKVIYFLAPTKGGNVKLSVVKNNYQGRVAKIDEQEQTAELWTQNQQGDWFIYEKYSITPDTITVDKYTIPKSQIGTTEAKAQLDLDSKDHVVYKNQFGFVPIVEIPNKVVNNMWGNTIYNVWPDWYPAMNLIELLNRTYRISGVETEANRTRYVGEMTPEEVQKVQAGIEGYGGAKDLMGDAYINVGFNNVYASNTQGAGLTIAQGNPQLQQYTDRIAAIRKDIFNAAGYTPENDDSNYENKTKAALHNQKDIETTVFKQSIREPKLYQLFDCILNFYGIKPFDETTGERIYSFKFINSDITDSQMLLDQVEKKLSMGTMSQVEARSILENETMEVAKQKISDVRKDAQEYNKMFGEQENEQGQDNDFDKVGVDD